MLKKWHETRPFTFGAVFIFLFVAIDRLDHIFIYPKMRPICNGEITDQQVRACTDWIRKEETSHVRVNKRGFRGLPGTTSSDEYLRDQERAIDAYGRTQNR